MAEFIQHEPHDETAWICLCGNTSDAEGFTPCHHSGEAEPVESIFGRFSRCERCQRVISHDGLRVEGYGPRTHRFTWRGIEVETTYSPRYFGGVIAHLAIRSIAPKGAPLPITETGYRSHFHQPGTIEAHGGDVVAQVTAWLDEEAAKPDWRAHVERHRQGELF